MTFVLDHDAIWPRDEQHRFRLYGRTGDDLRVLAAAPSLEAIGTAIAGCDGDQREAGEEFGDLGQIGILDVIDRRWIVNPFPQGPHV